jgi:hypothetical protein
VHLCTGFVGAQSAPYHVEKAQFVAAGSISGKKILTYESKGGVIC